MTVVRIFVDGGYARGLARAAAVVADAHGLLGVVRTATPSGHWTTQRSELTALRLGALIARRRPYAACEIWSDSLFALGSAQPLLSGWKAKTNRDLILPLRDELRSSRATTFHVYSHLNRKFGLADFFPHETADRLAADGVAGEFRISTGPVHPRCLTCALFPCRDPDARRQAISAYPEPCDRRVDWPPFVAVPAAERLRRDLQWPEPTNV